MDKKLTLKLKKDIIDKAKIYARKRQQSLSELVENYFRHITEYDKEEPLTPLVRELIGVIKVKSDCEVEKNYTDYLIEKYGI